MRDPVQTLGNLADRAGVAYLGSVDADGYPRIRAMLAPRIREGIREFCFTTNTSSAKVEQFLSNPKACVYFCDRRFFRGVTFVGRVEAVTQPELKERVWRAGDERYYPLGVTDPDYCVLRFLAESGEYYHDFKTERFEVTEQMR